MCIKKYKLNKKLQELKNIDLDVIVYAGQSNSMGYGIGNEELSFSEDDDILLYYKGKISKACERKINNHDKRAIFSLYFAKRYKEELLKDNHKILLIGAAVGGTGFSDHRWGIGEDLYKNLLFMTNKVLSELPKAKLKCLLWHQGEADIVNKASKDYYQNKLRALVEDYRNKTGCEDLPFVAGDYVPQWKEEEPYSFEIAKVTKEYVEIIKNGGYVSSHGLEGNPKPDEIHFCRKSLKELGERYFEKYKMIINE